MKESQRAAPSPLRLPDELKVWLKHQAIDNRRSLNSEITIRLEQSRNSQLSQPQGVAQ